MKPIITNANSRTLDQIAATVPNMSETVSEWFQNVIFDLIKKITVNFEVQELHTQIIFQGIVENISPQQLEMKPEGQRKWQWISVWATPELILQPDDIFRYRDKNYRVMSKNDWSAYGYVQYEAMEDYTS